MNQRDKFYDQLVSILRTENLPVILGWMAHHSQSVILNYGEDNELWECAWIVSSGIRFWSVEKTPLQAVKSVLAEVRAGAAEVLGVSDVQRPE